MTALVLLSGGLDSTTVLYQAMQDNKKVYTISFDYGQRHSRELEAVRKICAVANVPNLLLKISQYEDLYPSTSLLQQSSEQPTKQSTPEGEIPSTWVPQRNMLFLTLAFIYADSIKASKVYCGVNAVDYSGYPDCRPEFIEAAEKALNLARKTYVEGGPYLKIKTPLINLTKVQIVQKAKSLDAPLRLTWSCYYGGEEPCHECDSCRIREEALATAGY